MTTGKGTGALPARGSDFADAWREMRGNGDTQFAPVEFPAQEPPPDWLVSLLDAIARLFAPIGRFIVAIWPVLMWVLIAAGAALLLWLAWRTLAPEGTRAKRKARRGGEDWVPDQGEALALLEEADRLAAAGDYDEATHLLLKRSVGQIAAARPNLFQPSSTARELSADTRLPEAARSAFGVIAGRVERSLFALTRLTQDDWTAARTAYSDFALQERALQHHGLAA
ncbi:hypothetical protein [Aurantiacibacter luteus]|uniref:DUF4129 domain-containing protein n=1 Tax=Aurantiacibacter luteus TaxID=1581420 RepID=A0A0G9MTD5_9SPHN|nr:hypothetical protein [Aurantiacibacter luteus]KLE33990.1 hypothetical protein AAW00_06670 [Aurantiacibacter luteus]